MIVLVRVSRSGLTDGASDVNFGQRGAAIQLETETGFLSCQHHIRYDAWDPDQLLVQQQLDLGVTRTQANRHVYLTYHRT